MGTGQMLLTIGAIVLLGTIILTTNRNIDDNSQVLLKSNFGLEEVSLATSIIEQAEDLPFDRHTMDSTLVVSLAQLAPPDSLGWDSVYSGGYQEFNYFDDYDGPGGAGYNFPPDTLSTGIYLARTKVWYVDLNSLDDTSSTATWSKKLEVWVWNQDDPGDTVKMSTVYSYWWFR